MPRNKSITSIDNRIKKVQEDLFQTKARLDKLTAELRELEREKKLRQADAILQALSNLNISPKIDLGRRLICDRQVSLNFQAAYVDQIMI